MMCPKCESYKTIVINSRAVEENVFRIRQCKDCGNKFYSEEIEIDDEETIKAYLSAIKRKQRSVK